MATPNKKELRAALDSALAVMAIVKKAAGMDGDANKGKQLWAQYKKINGNHPMPTSAGLEKLSKATGISVASLKDDIDALFDSARSSAGKAISKSGLTLSGHGTLKSYDAFKPYAKDAEDAVKRIK